jgi:hypothetical protein
MKSSETAIDEGSNVLAAVAIDGLCYRCRLDLRSSVGSAIELEAV